MFDVGFSELFLVFIIGLIVLGPQRLPIAVKTIVNWMRTMRSVVSNIQNELAQELKLQELQDNLEKIEKDSKHSLSQELKESIDELHKTTFSIKCSHLEKNDKNR